MSANVEEEVSSPFSDGQSVLDRTFSKSSSHDSLDASSKIDELGAGQGSSKDDKSEPTTPKLHPMAFTVDFGEQKRIDKSRLEELVKKSQARHQRVQSMSASLTRPSPIAQKPPMSAKLPRKAQGYNSEGYFSSDQEDSGLSGSVKLRQSPLAQNFDRSHITSPIVNRHSKSPVQEIFQPKRISKSPIVDSIMSRSEILPSRQGLNLPIKNPNSSYIRDVHRTPSYNNLSTYQPRNVMADIIDQSPEGIMLTDISSPEFDILTPDNCLSTPEHRSSPASQKGRRALSETPDLFKRCPSQSEPLFIDDDVDKQSENSSTGTYTIEGDNYTEEQKARMSIDRAFSKDHAVANDGKLDTLKRRSASNERDPELIFDFPKVITKEPKKDVSLHSPLLQNQTFDFPNKVSNDKNVLEISCCYESPTENDLAAQTSKQIKSTRSYLEKIKNRVRNITEKTFAKSPPKYDADLGNFTSVTTSGVLSSKYPPKLEFQNHNVRRCSLTKSEIDKTDYIHRLSRESSVPVNLPSNKPVESAKFESTALRNAHAKAFRDESVVPSDVNPDQVVNQLSFLSMNRCKGDKTWIQEWAESVKKYNNKALGDKEDELNSTFILDSERPPQSPRRELGKCTLQPRSAHSSATTPTKIPSPVGTLLRRRTPDLIPNQETEAYLQKTQNAITNLQAKLHSSRHCNLTTIPPQLTSSLIMDKTAASRLPVSQLSRSNSLNYRLRHRDNSGDNTPLRSPGHYVITGSAKLPESTKRLLSSATRSLDADKKKFDSNMNSPCSEKGLLSNSSDDKTLSNKPYDVTAILSPHRKTHTRHKSFDGRTPNDHFNIDNANTTVTLKTVLKNNAMEAQNHYPRIDQTLLGDKRAGHQRVYSDAEKPLKKVYTPTAFSNSIKRSSSFNTVNKNNNYIDHNRLNNTRRHNELANEYKDMDYLSDESDNVSFEKSQDCRFKRPQTHRGTVDLKSIAPANSPRCPNTPEMHRKFGPGLVRHSVRVTNKERTLNSRMSEPPMAREERKPANHQSRRISEPTRQQVLNRLTKSRSSTREFQPKYQEKGSKKPSQHRSSSALASKEVELANWKKRSSYDPMKAALEGRRRQQMASKRLENKDDLSSPSHSSPVHRSQSFHTTNMCSLMMDSSEESEHEQLPSHAMITSTTSDTLEVRNPDYRELRRQAMNNDVVLARDYVAGFQVNQPHEKLKRRPEADKRKTFIIDDVTPTKENIDFLKDPAIDKRKTFILDSDDTTTNGSSPRNSSIFSHEKNSLTTGTSDTENDSGPESAPVVMRHPAGKKNPANPKQRHSGDYSMSSSTTSMTHKKGAPVAPRYLDISKYSAPSAKRDSHSASHAVSKGSARHYEMEQKKQELEKWKRRASYDPRKAAALAKNAKPQPKTASHVLRSQSFHGPMLVSTSMRFQPPPTQIVESYDASSDNDF